MGVCTRCVSLPVYLYVVMGVLMSLLIDALKVANKTNTVVHSQTLLQSIRFSLTAAWGPGFAFSADEPTLAQVLEQQPLIAMATIPLLTYSYCTATALYKQPVSQQLHQTVCQWRLTMCRLALRPGTAVACFWFSL